MKVAVIGGGPAGMSAAYELSKTGIYVEVFEAGPQVGGLAKTIELWDQRVDLGPHRFFSSDSRVNKLWLEVIGKDYHMVNRLTRIYYKQKFFHYPLKPLDALSKLGVADAAHCMTSYLQEKIAPTKLDGTFEAWVVHRFGRRLFNIFFKTYSEKLWGIKCNELDADFAAQRIKKLSLFEAVMNAFKGGKDNKHKTLVDQFAYPVQGTGMVYERMQQAVVAAGGNVFCNTPVKRVITENNTARALELESGEIKGFDHIVSSMPITLLVTRLPEVPENIKELATSLKFRNNILVYLNVNSANLFPDNWLYIHSDELQTGRITNFRNWVPEICNNQESSIVAMEYWCYDHDDIWNWSDDRLITLAKKELKQTKLTGNADIGEGHVLKIRRCYPVYSLGYKDKLKPIEQYLSSIKNLSAIGRYGAFKYNNQDHSILMGLLAAENIIKGASNNLWEINTDYDDYQERSVITETGLVEE